MTENATSTPTGPSEHAFRAEVNQVLDIVIHSLYSHREVFLRELISNAADALDKLRFLSVTDPTLLEGQPDLEIQIVPDRDAGVLRIMDTGVGMTQEALAENLGTIAHSGSKRFLDGLRQKGDEKKGGSVDLIGQFGVGFYSSFLVADRVEVRSLAAGEGQTGWCWASEAKGTYSLTPAPEWTTRGTEIRLHLGADHQEFLDEYRIRELVRRYSDFVSWPILLEVEREEGEGEDRKVTKTDETLNRASALWRRSKSEITAEEYNEFYRHVSHGFDEPLETLHFTIEGTTAYTALLFIPTKAPFDLFDREGSRGVRLYVKRVLIMDDCKDFVPQYLRFVRGVIDSDDLPLNVSRELLQEDRLVRSIRNTVTVRVLQAMEKLAENQPEAYAKFWGEFGVAVKEGLYLDQKNRERIAQLVRFRSTQGDMVSLNDYLGRMKPDQDVIYFATGSQRSAVEESPHIEALRAQGYEVLIMTDPIDEWAVEGLREFNGKKLLSAMKADIPTDKNETEADKAKAEAVRDRLEDLCERAQAVLSDEVSEVRVSRRLKDSPCCLVTPEGGLHAHIERLLRSQGQDLPKQKRILELNPDHPVVERLHLRNAQADNDPNVTEWLRLLYDQALLAEGSPIPEPARFARRMAELMSKALDAEAGEA